VIRKTIIYWRDIPSQVVVQKGRKREKALLSSRFQEAIDRAAMRAGKGEANRIEAEFSDDDLLHLIRNHGSVTELPNSKS